ncbi:V-type proton ATPase subunit E [subsurface metagenome]
MEDDLIAGIVQDASKEAERVLAEAKKAAAERIKAAQDQGRAVIQQAESKAEEQAARIRTQSASSMRMERRRISLKLREQAVQEALTRVRQRLADMVGSPEYRDVLLAWIVEGAIGLGAAEATVNAPTRELKQIDKKMLQAAESKVKELTGKKVTLTVASGDPLVPQGVVVKAAGGRVEFNNQVATRLQRLQSEIRKQIQDILWKNESSDR